MNRSLTLSRLLVLLLAAALRLPVASGATVSVTGCTPRLVSNAGGTTITVTGTGLSDAVCFPICNQAAFLIDGVPVRFRTPNPQTLIAVTPRHLPGAVSITYLPVAFEGGYTGGYTLTNALVYQADIPTHSRAAAYLLVLILALVGTHLLRRE
jgi:hypothetical protein